ncbi:MAG: TlpA disulfide reductase family protein [Capnocytophaga sp.]|nr:TlpA disulfide reductase family protein [Capnocytophaga sp.]
MKKIMLIAIAFAGLVACKGDKKTGFVINGTVEGASDGDMVYLEKIENMKRTGLDSTLVKNGAFSFKGVQDSTALRYVTCLVKDDVFSVDFFLENGDIQIKLDKGKVSAVGTPLNDTYQKIRSEADALLAEMNVIYDEIDRDSTMSKELMEEKMDKVDAIEKKHSDVVRKGLKDNITNPIGVLLFKQTYFENTLDENLSYFSQIPAKFHTDKELMGMKGQMDVQQKTNVNKPFVDLTMQTPDGKTAKLSDYVGKGKIVLVDFWASWCGPCRQEMPELIKLYEKHKGKLEIVGVSLDEDADAWKKAIDKLGLPWIHLSDLKGWKSEAVNQYGMSGIPFTLLLNNDGIVIAHNLRGEILENKLDEIIK